MLPTYCCTAECSTADDCTADECTADYFTAEYCTADYSTANDCTADNCTADYCTAYSCTEVCCTTLLKSGNFGAHNLALPTLPHQAVTPAKIKTLNGAAKSGIVRENCWATLRCTATQQSRNPHEYCTLPT